MDGHAGAREADGPSSPRGHAATFSRVECWGWRPPVPPCLVLPGSAGASTSALFRSGRERKACLAPPPSVSPGPCPTRCPAGDRPAARDQEHRRGHDGEPFVRQHARHARPGRRLPLGPDGKPTVALPDGHGNLVHAFHMPSECQTNGVGQTGTPATAPTTTGPTRASWRPPRARPWATSSAVRHALHLGLARRFPIADRWFCSVMAQTDPNRRYLFAGTSLGLINDTFPGAPPQRNDLRQSSTSTGSPGRTTTPTPRRRGVRCLGGQAGHHRQVREDGRVLRGRRRRDPAPVLLSNRTTPSSRRRTPRTSSTATSIWPRWSTPSCTVRSGPSPADLDLRRWGGWYDHVRRRPPSLPTTFPPTSRRILPGASTGTASGSAGVVSPYARRDYVSHTVYDHTSVLKTVETKWNLPALTRRTPTPPMSWP